MFIFKNRIIVIAMLILALGIIWVAFSDKLSRPNEPLIVSGHPEWAPIMWQENDKIVGVGPELVAMIFNDLEIKAESKYAGPWDVVQQKAKTGEIDILAAAYKTTERESDMDYSLPYTIDPIAIFVKKGNSFPYEKWEDLKNKKGVAMTGDSYGQELDNYIKDNFIIERVATSKDAFSMLQNKKADYFLYALYSGEKEIKNQSLGSAIEILPKYAASENFYITVSKESPFNKYLSQINAGIEKYKADGTINSLIQKYSGQNAAK
jgi:polar amino acid transport system substrate-binding protein